MNHDLFCSSIQSLLEGRTTALQKSMIEEAMISDEYKELYFKLLEDWESKNLQLVVDTNQAFTLWSSQSINEQHTQQYETKQIKMILSWKYFLVASIVLVMGLVGYYFQNALFYQEYVTGANQIKTLYLAEGTRVTLNKNSSIRYPRLGFGWTDRKVDLVGEAEFSVTHLPKQQSFIVSTVNGVNVKVLGTEFVVLSEADTSKVILNKGKVEITSKSPDILRVPLVMKPGDVVAITKAGQLTWDREQQIELNSIWRNHRFRFDNTTVLRAIDEIENVFGVDIQIEDSSLALRTIGGTFQADSVDKVLEVLAEVLDIKVITKPSSSAMNRNAYLLVN